MHGPSAKIVNTYKCYYCECETYNYIFHHQESPTVCTREHVIPHSLIKANGKQVEFNTTSCCVFCNKIHSKILNALIETDSLLYHLDRARKPSSIERIRKHIAEYLTQIQNNIMYLGLIVPWLTNYNPCVIYIANMIDPHPKLLNLVGKLKLNDQSYTNVPV